MAGKLLKFSLNLEQNVLKQLPLLTINRYGHTIRGKAPGIARTLEQRLKDENPIDEEIAHRIDIGFPQLRPSRAKQIQDRVSQYKNQRSDPNLEKAARSQTLTIDLEQVKNDWQQTCGPYHIREIANHYGVYEHLFGYAYFNPRIPMKILYNIGDGKEFAPVYYGNVIKPTEAAKEPTVQFDSTIELAGAKLSEKNSLWTLIMTNPDGHLTENDKEYVHWFIANIPGSDLSKGDVIAPYLQPFPPRGTGFHRHIFVLYRQNCKLDLKEYSVKESFNLNQRTFSTLEFYRKHQDNLTPASLAFFQSNWDANLTDFYHKQLSMKEPIYEYDFPAPYIRDQTWFPLRQPFNLYLDKYRDEKEIAKEFIARKLSKTHPFDGPEPKLRYPNAHAFKNVPSWLRVEKKKSRLGWGRINEYK